MRDGQSPEELGLSDNDVIKLVYRGVIVIGQPDSGRGQTSVVPAIPSIDFIQIAPGEKNAVHAASGDSEGQMHEFVTLSIRDEEVTCVLASWP